MIKLTILAIILYSLIIRNLFISTEKNKPIYFILNFLPYVLFALFLLNCEVAFFKFFMIWAFAFAFITTLIEYFENHKLLLHLTSSILFWFILILYPWNIDIQVFNEYVYTAANYIQKAFSEKLSAKLNLEYILTIGTGAYFVATEANYIVKHILNKNMTVYHNDVSPNNATENHTSGMELQTEPAKEEIEIELQRGKIIGAIERVMIFFFVIAGEFSAIAFIIAAKSIARFKELEDKEFAEYFLIGTLLSTAVATLTGVLFKSLIYPL